jgi:cobalt-zinc-cadmium resistance protein CzcA
MLRALVAWSLSFRVLVGAFALTAGILGGWAFSTLPVDAYPDIAQTQVKIILKAPGMTPEEVETRIIAPIELEMLGLPRQSVLRSTAKYALADITIDFDEGTDIYWARQQVSERLAGAMADMPDAVSGGMAPISTPLSEVFMFTIECPLSLTDKRELLDWTIRPALRTVAGVADVNTLGGFVRTYEVRPDPVKLAAAGLTVDDLSQAVKRGNRNDGSGRLGRGDEVLIVRAVGAVRDADDLRQMVIVARNDRIVRLGDIATIGAGAVTRYGAVTRDGQEAVQGLVLALRGADARKVVEGVEARLAELKSSLPAGTSLNVFYNRSDLIEHAVGTVQEALLEAIILVIVLLVIFLGDWRAAAIVAATLPMAALITFLAMRYMGMSANLMSLGGLAIAIGMLVDGAVVVVENVVERLGHEHDAGTPRLNVIFRATAEVVVPVSAGLLIIALVFLPLLSLQGLEGKLFAPVAMTIMFSLAAALLLALTLVPVLASFGLKRGHHGEPWIMRKLGPGYHRLLAAAFERKLVVYIVAGLGLVLAVLAYGRVGKTFMPTMDEGAVVMQVAKLPSIGLARSIEVDSRIEKAVLAAVPEVESVIARMGTDEIGLDPMGLNETDMFMRLKPREEWGGTKQDIVDRIRRVMEGIPGLEQVFTQPIEMRVSEMLTGARGDLAVKIFGPDLQTLGQLAGKIETTLRAVPGASEVVTAANNSVDYLQLDVDRAAAGRFGMPVDMFEDALRAQVEGLPSGMVIEGQKRIAILVRGGDDVRDNPAAFRDLQLVTPTGTLARVSDIARVAETQGPVVLSHESGGRYALVQAFVSGRDLVGFVEDAKARVAAEVPLPAGYRLVWGGQFENQQRAAARLMLVIPIALLLIFFVLFATLKSLRGSLLILANIPFAAVGGIVSLWISGDFLSVPASVGFIALLGIAVLNGLVLVSYFRQLRRDGVPLAQAVRLGAERRLRPVLMTASITAFGLVPLLFATGPGSEIQKPLAIVVIGGLVTSTLLTLVLLPLLYERFGESRVERAA